MTREQARRKFDGLNRMTESAGCTHHESETARRLATVLAKRWGFDQAAVNRAWRKDFDERYTRGEKRAAMRFRWEYRRCGKTRCHCAGPGATRHGPYRYGKKRDGKTVRSVYIGR